MSENETSIVKSEGFAIVETRRNAETAAITMAAKVRANIEAACVMAERHPRNWLNVRARLLDECKRPGFCDGARYDLPRKSWDNDKREFVTTFISGFSIRFAEAALRYLTNMSASSEVIYEDDDKQMVLVTVRDFEANTSIETSVNVPKRVEHKKLKKNEKPLSTRTNSYGDTIYILPSTDDEIAMKHNSLVSKAIRNAVLRMLPGDIADECEDAIARTKRNKHAEDPQAATKKVVDAFAGLRVMPDQLSLFVGHSLETLSPKELDELRGIYTAIKDGEIAWQDALDSKLDTSEGPAPAPAAPEQDGRRMNLGKRGEAPTEARPAPAQPKSATKSEPPPAPPTVTHETVSDCPWGDVEDALIRLQNAPREDVEHLARELRTEYRWTVQDKGQIGALLDRLGAAPPPTKSRQRPPPPPNPDDDGR